jgi:hypothetical protein
MRSHTFLCFVLIFLSLLSCSTDTNLYFYTDQNNNTYTIAPSEIRFDPITPNESSSGVYSGGEKAVIPISINSYKKIVQLTEALQEDTIHHIGQREMRTAILLTEKDGQDVSRFILLPSERRTALEKLLKDLVE